MAKSPKINPLNDRVVIRRLEADEEVMGGIIIPDTAKEKPQKGEIVAVGPGKVGDENERIVLEVKVGDIVLFGKYSGTEVTVLEEELLIMREDDVLAIIG